MAYTCKQLARPSHAESDLYSTIYNDIAGRDEEKAMEIYNQFSTKQFLREFGDWIEDYNRRVENVERREKGEAEHSPLVNQSHIDDKGEPRLFLDAEEGRFYYVDKHKRKRFFYKEAGLDEIYSYSEILNISKILAFNYIKGSTDMNFGDLNISNIGETLSESITKKLKDTIERLENSGDEDKIAEAEALLESTDHIDEWEQHVRDYFRGLKLVYSEVEESQEIEQAEETTRSEAWSYASFERSMKENISTNVKLRLSLLTDDSVRDPIFDEPVFIPFDEVYSTLLQKLTNRVAVNENGTYQDMFEIYLKEIEGIMHRKPYFQSLYEGLVDADENLKYEFVQAFNLDKYNFMTTELQKNPKQPSVRTYTVMNVSGVGSKGKTLQSNWYNDFNSYFLNKHGKFLYDRRDPNNIIDRKGELQNRVASIDRVITTFSDKVNRGEYKSEQDLKGIKDYITGTFHVLGVDVSPAAFDLYLDNLSMHRASLSERINTINKTLESTEILLKDLVKGNINANDSNPFASQNIFNALAEAEAFYTNEGSDANIFAAGKSKWVYSKPNYLSYTVKEWKKNPKLLEAKLDSAYGESSRFIKYLLAHEKAKGEREKFSQQRLNELEVTTFNTFQEKGKGLEGKDTSDISISDFNVDTLNKLLRVDGPPIYSSPTPADKGTHHQIQIGHRVRANAVVLKTNNSISIDGNVVEMFYDYFKSEYNRIKEVYNEIETIPEEDQIVHYHLGNQNGLKSQLFPSLSFDKFEGTKGGHNFELYDSDNRPALDNLDAIKDELMDYIEARLIGGIETTLEGFKERGIIEDTNEGTTFPGVDSKIVDYYRNLRPNNIDLRIAADAYVNGLMSQVEYAKLFSGDVAFYKNSVDYKKRIPATYTDGLQLRLRSYNEVTDEAERERLRDGEYRFNAAVVDGVEIGSPMAKELDEMLKPEVAKYYKEGINSTDAQAWITPQRWKFLMERLGKWDSTYEALYNKIMSDGEVKLEAADLKKVMQPLKGVYFDINSGVPTYLKYSQAVLIPSLVKGSPLQKIYDKMVLDENGNEKPFSEQIHETITIDGVKVGANKPVRVHDDNGNIIDDFNLTSLSLSNSGWKLQQDLPTKTYKDIPVGSQIQKNIFGGLANNLDKTFLVGDTEMKGSELIEHINGIMEALSDRGRSALIDEFTIRTNGGFGNVDSVYKAMIEELKGRGGNQNIIDALEARVSPYGIPQAQKTLMNVLSSMFLKRLVKVKTNGGAFIQLSNFGLSKTEGDGRGVIWSPKVKAGETTKEPHYLKDENGEYVLTESGDKIVKPGEVLVSGSFIAKYIPNYKDYSAKQLFGEYNPNTGKYEAYTDENGKKQYPIIDNDILQGLVGYRIPNQGLASNDALQIVGIMPEEVGDTIVAYTGITTKTGSDFDIDKMYLMMPSFIPDRGVKSRLKNYVKSAFKKDTKPKTVASIREVVNELALTDVDVDGLAKLLMGTKNEKALNRAISKFTLAVLDNMDNARGDNQVLKTMEVLARTEKVERLRYATPDTDKDGNVVDNSEQSRESLNNMLIQAYKAVLTSPHTINEVMTPIDFDYVKNDINDLHRKEPPSDLDDFDIFKDITLKYEFIAGKAGVGQEANALVDHVRGLMADLYLNDTYLGRGHKTEDGNTLLDRENSEELSTADMKAYFNDYNEGKSEKDKLKWKDFQELKSIKIANSLSAVLNAFVDIAKDPYITRGNWTTQTTNTGNMLLRAGFHPFYVNAFLGQPIISQYIDFVTNKESKLVDDTGSMKDKFRVQYVKDRYLQGRDTIIKGRNISYTEIYDSLTTYKNKKGDRIFSSDRVSQLNKGDSFDVITGVDWVTKDLFGNLSEEEDMALASIVSDIQNFHTDIFNNNDNVTDAPLSTLRKQIKGESDSHTQIAVLNQFFKWQDLTKSIRESVKASKIDVSGYGKSIGSLINMDNTIAKLLATGKVEPGALVGFSDKLRKNGKNTLLGGYKKNIIDWTKKIMQSNPLMFLSANPYVVSTYNQISLDVKGDLLTDETLTDKVEEGYYSYLLSGFTPLQVDAQERNYLINQFPTDFEAVLEHPDVKEAVKEGRYRLLEELYLKPGDNRITYISMSNRKKSPELDTEITASWKDILNGDFDEIIPDFGDKLIKYAYLTSGFKVNINQFFTYIPTSWFIENGIDTYIADNARQMSTYKITPATYDEEFIDQFYRHNMDDNQLVPNFSRANGQDFKQTTSFVTKSTDKARRFVKMTVNQPTGDGTVVEKQYLYKLQGYKDDGRGVYVKVQPLGMKDKRNNRVYEYGYDSTIDVSAIEANRLAAKVNPDAVREYKALANKPAHYKNPPIATGRIDLENKKDDELNCEI